MTMHSLHADNYIAIAAAAGTFFLGWRSWRSTIVANKIARMAFQNSIDDRLFSLVKNTKESLPNTKVDQTNVCEIYSILDFFCTTIDGESFGFSSDAKSKAIKTFWLLLPTSISLEIKNNVEAERKIDWLKDGVKNSYNNENNPDRHAKRGVQAQLNEFNPQYKNVKQRFNSNR